MESKRQYLGMAGRTQNCQVGVFLVYASSYGHTFIERELYLPKSWTNARQRCERAGVPENVEFATRITASSKNAGASDRCRSWGTMGVC